MLLTLQSAYADSESVRRGLVKSGFAMALNYIQARNENLACDFEAYQFRITDVVDQTISLATKEEFEIFQSSIPKDSDVWENFLFKVILGYDHGKLDAGKMKKYLEGSKFWGPSSAVGFRHTMEFIDGGKVKEGKLMMPETGRIYWTYETLDWELTYKSASDVQVRVGTSVYNFKEIHGDFILTPAKDPEAEINSHYLSSSPMECDA